jgi:TatD DNase family protein
MDFPVADAHIHLADLLEREPGFPERLSGLKQGNSLGTSRSEASSEPLSGSLWTCCASSHDEAEWERVESLRTRLPHFVSSFGIHPQSPALKHADFLARLAAEGRIAAIGEAGFDFYGDRPERVRNEENEGAQRAVFEYQLELAERHGLPLLLHLRKSLDLAFAYAPRLKRLRAAIFHSFPGSGEDARSFLARGVNAFFSFGAPIINGNKRAAASCASIPEDRLLSETDAPWQPPRRGPGRGADYCRPEDLELVVEGMAALRGSERSVLEPALERNFAAAFGSTPDPPGD